MELLNDFAWLQLDFVQNELLIFLKKNTYNRHELLFTVFDRLTLLSILGLFSPKFRTTCYSFLGSRRFTFPSRRTTDGDQPRRGAVVDRAQQPGPHRLHPGALRAEGMWTYTHAVYTLADIIRVVCIRVYHYKTIKNAALLFGRVAHQPRRKIIKPP